MILLATIFVITLAATGGTYLLVTRTMESRDASRIRDRLVGKSKRASDGDRKETSQKLFAGEGEKTAVARLLGLFNVDFQLRTLIEQAGVSWAPGQVALACLLAALGAFNVAWYMAPLGVREAAFVLAPIAGSLPIFWLKRKRTKRIQAFESQFPDALLFIARAMRAGHAFSVSLDMLHREMSEPVAGEFRICFEEQNLGLPIDVALDKLAKRMPLLDVRFFVAAVVLQKRTGGNLGEILEKLASLIRERFKLRGQIRAISAQGRMSSAVLTAIPVVVAFMLYFVNKPHMMFFVEEDIGRLMAGAAAGFVLLGFLVMRQIVKIEV